jgi:hypothetical protein
MKQLDKDDYKLLLIIVSVICVVLSSRLTTKPTPPKQFGIKIERHY